MLFFKGDDDLHNLREVNSQARGNKEYTFVHLKNR